MRSRAHALYAHDRRPRALLARGRRVGAARSDTPADCYRRIVPSAPSSVRLRVKPPQADFQCLGDGLDGSPLGVGHPTLDARISRNRQPRTPGDLFLRFAAFDARASDRKAECLVHRAR